MRAPAATDYVMGGYTAYVDHTAGGTCAATDASGEWRGYLVGALPPRTLPTPASWTSTSDGTGSSTSPTRSAVPPR